MTNVTMKAVDTLHISSVKADNIMAGEEFEVAGHLADDLEQRGLATRASVAPVPEAKQEPAAPENKMVAAPLNKSTTPKAVKGK